MTTSASARGWFDEDGWNVVGTEIVIVFGNWRGVALRGAAGVAFGLLALFWPGPTLTVLVLLVGAYMLVDGAALLIDVIRAHPMVRRRWLLALEGVVGVAAGALTLLWPGITALALLWVIAAWALLTGAAEIAAALRVRPDGGHNWLVGVLGLLSIALAVILVVDPGAGALAVTWAIGWYGVFFGITLLVLAQRLRRLQTDEHLWRRVQAGPPTAA